MVSVRHFAATGIALLTVAAPAAAHIGASVAKAAYTHPMAPVANYSDGSVHPDYSSYAPETADASYHIDWLDGDVDPTGKFTFYYLDHGVSDGVDANDIEMIATHVVDVKGRQASNIYTSCTCALDAGVVCPDLGDGGVRWCDNFVDWDTSALPNGSYWLAAVNNDPPFHVYNLSLAPIRVAHGAKPPPVVLVEFPDGLGYADRTYHIEVIAIGTGTMKLDLAWGDNRDPMVVLGPVHAIATGLPVVVGSDGMTGDDWDVSMLPDGPYFVRATLTDDNGQVYSDGRYPQAVFHDPDGGMAALDLSAATPDDGGSVLTLPMQPAGCSCSVAARPRATPTLLFLVAAAALAIRRRGRRPCSRSGCTG